MKKVSSIVSIFLGLGAALLGEQAWAADFKLGFGNCPSTVHGPEGDIMDFDIILNLTSNVTESGDGAQGWSFGITVTGGRIVEHHLGELDGLQTNGVIVQTIFTRAAGQPPIDPSPFDLGYSALNIIQSIPLEEAEATSAVAAVVFNTKAGANRVLHPKGTEPIGKLKVRATVPSIVTLQYAGGLAGAGQPVGLVVTWNGASITPSTETCQWELAVGPCEPEKPPEKPFVNLALSGKATQSSTFTWQTVGASEASRAIDGNTNGNWYERSVTHTDVGDPDPWWQVDLGGTHALSRIVLWNRTDCCWSDRLSNFRVSVLDDSQAEVFGKGYFTNGVGSFSGSFPIDLPNGTNGRHVRIALGPNSSDLRVLSLAEVEVLVAAASKNGDVNGDSEIDISDAVYLLKSLFLGGPEPVPFAERSQPAQPLQRFRPNCGGTVTDSKTGLMWQRETAPERYNWQGAIDYCNNLQLGGYDDWRLPDIEELKSIIDPGGRDPAIDPVFGAFRFWYWSSTSVADGPDGAWIINFDVGFLDGAHYVSNGGKDNNLYVRAVRSGP